MGAESPKAETRAQFGLGNLIDDVRHGGAKNAHEAEIKRKFLSVEQKVLYDGKVWILFKIYDDNTLGLERHDEVLHNVDPRYVSPMVND